jgi:uncharacterized RDD family membrane protein YckC/uncharacterized membrane protein YgcG
MSHAQMRAVRTMTHPGTLHDGGKRTASIVPPLPSPPSPVTPGREDVLGLRVAAALIDLAFLAGLFLIIASAAGLVTAAGGSFRIWLSSAWWAAFAAVAGLYYLVLETVSGQTVSKRLLGVHVCGSGRTRPSARAVAGRTLLRVVDFLPVMYLSGIVAPGVRRRRIAGLAARRAVARAAPVRHRVLAVVPLAVVLLAAAGPAGWQQHSGAASTPVGGTRELWGSAAGPGTPYDLTSFRVSRTVPGAAARAPSPPRSSATSTTPPSGSTTHGSSPVNGMPGNGGLGAKVVPAPAGFALSQSPPVPNGPMSAADFNQYWGDAASLHFVRGYDVAYDSNDGSVSIEVTLFQFATPADAAAFKADWVSVGVKSKADPVIPGADDYDSTSPYQGFYDHGVIAAKGNLAFVIDDLTGSAAPVPLVETMARQQYAALFAPGRATALPAPGRATAQASAERITSYHAGIAIQRDGSILVTEQIVYNFGSDQRHGIFRAIPVRLRYNGTYDRIYAVDVQSVDSPDAPAQYTVDNNGSYVSIKIGDPNQTVTGEHMYTLTYLVRGSLNAFADHDELYWNAVGNQWDVPIDQATVQVSAPADVTRAACFAGPLGSTAPCQQAGITSGVASFGQAGLGPNEGMTVVVAIPKGVVASAGPVLRERWSLQRAFAVTPVSAGAAGGLLAVLAVLGAMVLARDRDRRHSRSAAHVVGGTAVQAEEALPLSGHGEPAMQSAPPADMRPGQAGTLLDGVANPRDVTGTIVDLAVRGYLRIDDAGEQTSRDWSLVRLDKTGGGLLDYEQILLDGLFKGPTTVKTSTLLSELGPDFAGSLKQAQDALYADVAGRGWFTARPDKVRRRWVVIGCVLFVTGVAGVIAAAATSHFGLIPVPVALAGLVLVGCARWMPVRTAKGTDLTRRLLGFRRYITTVAPGQAPATGQAPAGQHDAFEDYLPYAIVFGCTKQWADVTAALAGADRAPSWYRSRRPYSPSTLTALSGSGYYFSSMHHFATNTSNRIASAASGGSGSSGFFSGGSSGFSGGGFSGGGGGGGGGGSW